MRRGTAVILLWVAAAAVVVTVAASVAALARYVAFQPLAHPFLTFFAASVLAIVALHSLMRGSPARLPAQTGIGVLCVCATVMGLAVTKVSPLLLEAYDPVTVATAPDVKVVAWKQELTFGQHVVLRLRSREWLLSRDGTTDLACFTDWLVPPSTPSEWTFASATVTGNTLTARTTDGHEWRVGFDPATLRPTTPMIDRCTGMDYAD